MSAIPAIPRPGTIAISDLIGTTVVRVPAQASVAEVAATLIGQDLGVVVVGDEARPVALISERDVVRVVADGRDPAQVSALDVASKNLMWCAADDTVEHVAMKMTDRHVRHLLVEDGDNLVGVVSARDLLGVYAAEAEVG